MPALYPLEKKDIDNILKHYSIGKHKSHKHLDWALVNTVYELKTTRGKYILKVCGQADEAFIKFQIKIINYLDQKNLPIANIMRTKSGRLYHHNDLPVIIQKFLPGKHPKKYNDKLIHDIAKNMAIINKYLLRLKLNGIHVWRDHFKPFPLTIGTSSKTNFRTDEKRLLKEFNKLNKKKIRRSIIHSDLRDVNFLVKNNKITAFIDWDDAHEDYLPYEIAVFLMDPSVKNKTVNKKFIHLFLEEYQKHLKLSLDEKKAIYYLIQIRFLSVIGWHHRQMKIHKEHKKRLNKSREEIINNYQTFRKLTAEEFLDLC